MINKIWRIYCYTNVVTCQKYIGQTVKNVNKRAESGTGYGEGTPFRNAIDEYGWDSFEQSILRLCTSQEDADYYENVATDYVYDDSYSDYAYEDSANYDCVDYNALFFEN